MDFDLSVKIHLPTPTLLGEFASLPDNGARQQHHNEIQTDIEEETPPQIESFRYGGHDERKRERSDPASCGNKSDSRALTAFEVFTYYRYYQRIDGGES